MSVSCILYRYIFYVNLIIWYISVFKFYFIFSFSVRTWAYLLKAYLLVCAGIRCNKRSLSAVNRWDTVHLVFRYNLRWVNLKNEGVLWFKCDSLGLPNHSVAHIISHDVIVLGWRFRHDADVHVTHGFLVRRRRIRKAHLPRCDVITRVNRVRLVALPPLIHGNDGKGGVSLSDSRATLGSFAHVAPPHGDRDGGDKQQQQQQGQDKVQGVASTHYGLKSSGRGAALPLILLPESPLQPITQAKGNRVGLNLIKHAFLKTKNLQK